MQDITKEFSVFDYMSSFLKLNNIKSPEKLNEMEAIKLFCLLPDPEVTYEDWVNKIAALAGIEEEEEKPVLRERDPLERLKNEHQHLFKAGIVYLGKPVYMQDEKVEEQSA